MDDREFLDELEHLEPASRADDSAHVRERTLDELDEGLSAVPKRAEFPREIEVPREVERIFESAPVLRTTEPEWVGAPPPRTTASELSGNQIAWLTTGFLALMLAGGASAALVFHQRVAAIISLLR